MKTSKKQTKLESRKRNYTKPEIKKREQIKEVTEGGVPTVTHVVVSDRNAKKNFQSVDTVAVLEKLAAIPIERWNYQWEKDSDVPHLGPMAQDFKGAFYPGRDDKTISMLEFDGVALAAIQGLNQKMEQKETEITELKARLERLEQLVIAKNGGGQ